MGVGAAIIAFFKALPEMVGLVRELTDAIKSIKAEIELKNRLDRVHEKNDAFRELRNAKTTEDKFKAAEKLSNVIGGM